MKTLDEVIEAERHCIGIGCRGCPYDIVTYGGSCECDEDALFYLKEFQGLSKMWNDRLDKEQENSPLTWDELRTMEGKPVWVEPCKEWMLITEIETEPHIWLLSLDGLDYDMSLHEWQAYRKERE